MSNLQWTLAVIITLQVQALMEWRLRKGQSLSLQEKTSHSYLNQVRVKFLPTINSVVEYWHDGNSTSTSFCKVGGGMVEVQVFRKEFRTHILRLC